LAVDDEAAVMLERIVQQPALVGEQAGVSLPGPLQ
jgi:hypothetical protein